MATTIVTKSGSGAPTASDLVAGELAVDLTNKRLYTEDSGGTVLELGTNPSGNVTFGDNGKAIFGADSDLQIYHDGSNSIIYEGGTGDLQLRGNGGNTTIMNGGGTETLANFGNNGAVTLYYDNAVKLASSATGIDVTGTADVTLDLNVGGAVKGNAGTRAISVGVAGSVNGGLQLWSTTAGTSYVQFGDEAGTAANHYRGYMSYAHANDSMALGTAGSTKVTVTSAGNVGIGNTIFTSARVTAPHLVVGSGSSSPGLTLYGAFNSQGSINFADSTSGTDSYDGSVLYAFGSGSPYMSFHVNGGAERMRIDAGGYVGIGTSSPNTTLTLSDGTDEFDFGVTANQLMIKSVTSDGFDDQRIIIDAGNGGQSSARGAYIALSGNEASTEAGKTIYQMGNVTGSSHVFRKAGGSDAMTIDASGNFIVGATSAFDSSSFCVDQSGFGQFRRDGTPLLVRRDGSVGDLISFEDDGASVGSIATVNSNIYLGTGDTGLYFNAGDNTVMPINVTTGAGRDAGIDLGKSDTRFKDLYLSGSAYTPVVQGLGDEAGLTFGGALIAPRKNNAAADGAVDLGTSGTRFKDLYLSGNAHADNFVGTNDTDTFVSMSGSNIMRFYNGGAERMRIASNGSLLVGRTDNFTFSTNTTDGVAIQPNRIDVSAASVCRISQIRDATGTYDRFYNGSSIVGSITGTASATAYNTSSDYRLKENVVAMSGATERLKQLKPSRFNFIADADTTVDGFLAHEVQDIVPEAITGTKDAVDAEGNPDYQGIDQSKLVPLLVATIQELEARIAALES